MKFTAIDFETATSDRASVCAVGIVVYENGRIVDQIHQLIQPIPLVFDPFNVSIHGITPADVADAPTFAMFWPQLWRKVSGPLVAHNASFDMSVLRHALDQARQKYPETDYLCTRVMARLAWPNQPTYALDYISHCLDIEFAHHDPVEDARACAEIAVRVCDQLGASSFYELESLCGLRIGCLYSKGYLPCGAPRAGTGAPRQRKPAASEKRVPSAHTLDTEHPCHGSAFVFTGTLASMPRDAAKQRVLSVGGICHGTVKRDTNYLVLGQTGFHGYQSGHKSQKMKRAEGLAAQGYPIEIIPESDFLERV